jgi:predicted DCC family thiol-disulfide oxidoreductase YuxK
MTERERVAIEGRALLLYDGVCALCHGLVRFLLKHDRRAKLRYTSLQSVLGVEILARFGIRTLPDGVVLVTDALTLEERLFQRSDAVQTVLQLLERPWGSLGKALELVPRSVRESGYGVVARLRYRLFGRYEVCPLPPPEQRNLILGVYE